MKSKEVLEILKVTRQTLCNYVKQGHIKVTKLGNGYYDYDKKSVYIFFLNIDLPNDRLNVIYARVSTYKNDLD
jgi:predicted site-specific integrase-resolvase